MRTKMVRGSEVNSGASICVEVSFLYAQSSQTYYLSEFVLIGTLDSQSSPLPMVPGWRRKKRGQAIGVG